MYRIAKLGYTRHESILIRKTRDTRDTHWYRLNLEDNKRISSLLFLCGIKITPVPYYLNQSLIRTLLNINSIEAPEKLNSELDKIKLDPYYSLIK